MTVMSWFRKHNKKLMVGIGLVVMVAFGLPTAMFRGSGQKDPSEVIVAYYTDFSGVEHDLSMGRLQSAEVEVDVLRALGLVEMTLDRGVIRNLSGLQGMSEYPIWAANLVLFPSDGFVRQGVGSWGQILQQSDWAENDEEVIELGNKIIQMCSVEPAMSVRYFVLLAEEAHQAGITTSQAEIDIMKTQFRSSGVSVRAICRRFNISEGQFDRILGDYVAILRYGDMVTRALGVSEAHIKKAALNQEEIQTVNGMYVTFEARQFLDQAPEPNLAELEGQLERYKNNPAGRVDDENLYGFGYKLGDRVQLEYLRVDLEGARGVLRERFNGLDVRQQEEQLQDYWRKNRYMFREEISPAIPATQTAAAVAAEYRDLEFDEAVGQVREQREADEARRWADRVLSRAKDASLEALNRTELTALSVAERREKAVDYEALAVQVSEAELPVSYGKTDFWDIVRLSQSDEFSGAYQERSRGMQAPLERLVFNCEPLFRGVESRLDEPPIRLYEDIDSVVVGDFSLYLVRIVEVNKERAPVSLLDDGLSGAAGEYPEVSLAEIEALLSDPNRPLDIYSTYQAVRGDWEAKEALALARAAAEEFAAAAEGDWDEAIKQYNDLVTADPNDFEATGRTIWENSLESSRTRMLQYQQQMENMDPQYAQIFQSSIMQAQMELRAAMELAQERGGEASGRAVLVQEDKQKCMVFKDLRVTPPTLSEYQHQKPLIAQNLIGSNQGLMCLWHFNPENIEKRTKYTLAENE